MGKNCFEKIWERHIVYQESKNLYVLYIDIHYIHEVTSPQAFNVLKKKNLKVQQPNLTFATADHNVSTVDQNYIKDTISCKQIETLEKNCQKFGIKLFGLKSPYQGIVHVIGPELGITQPGKTIVCGDSHTSTHGALGTLAWGIGTSEVAYVLATQSLLVKKPKIMRINLTGKLPAGTTAKDVILYIIKTIGVGGGIGYAIEYAGEIIQKMSIEERMTICNMSIEASARFGLVSPDKKTINYLKNRQYAPKGKEWERAVEYWQSLKSDEDSHYDKEITIDCSSLKPMITFGINPSMVIPITGRIPKVSEIKDAVEKEEFRKALEYMNFKPGQKLEGFPIQEVFIGSCTNARLSDLMLSAKIIKGKKVKKGIKALVVPGSKTVKRLAEKEGLDKIFKEAGFSWRWSGCSACIAMNEDKVQPGNYCVSTTNRNYIGRQGPGARTILTSPLTAAITAIEGKLVDVRQYLE